MKKEKQIGLRVSLPCFFMMELDEFYRKASGAHRAMKLNDFAGYLIGLGFEAYKAMCKSPAPAADEPDSPGLEKAKSWGVDDEVLNFPKVVKRRIQA